ncbi:MAG: helix-turn-helix domain-containing protein [Spirochaetaceae bacterium]|nr:helix-turn-helix domain-containing protein [Spirochaetaceae bacterium]
MKTLMKVQQLLAANVKLARKRMGLSQMRLAELAHLSTSFIGEIELGKKFPSAENFERLSEALGLRPYQLVYEAEDWEAHDKYDHLAGLRTELKEKLNTLLEEVIRTHLGK